MNPLLITIISLSIIFLSNTLGAAGVFFIRKKLSSKISNALLGFTSGIMICAGLFGLLIPSIEESQLSYPNIPYVPVLVGFLVGGLVLFLLDKVIPHFHQSGQTEEGPLNNSLSKQIKFLLAVTIHNIPEGLSVGFACGIALTLKTDAAIISALSLAIGMSIQNVPEGAAVSIPLHDEGMSKGKSFLYGTLSGIVEPIFGLLGLLLATSFTFIMPWLLAFGAGAMIYVTVDELLPSARKDGFEHYGIWAFMIGFAIMMLLEII